jgi:C-terminal processing protease CtpA/Prc
MRLVQIWEALSVPQGLSRQRLGEYYWYQYLPETKALYLQYSTCREMPDQPFRSFVTDLFAFADSHTVERIVVDLRRNGGGSSRVVKPLVRGLKARPELTGRGHLYALIGRRTVSSGMFAALDLKNECDAVLVGEPTGAKPNAYGDRRSFRLPSSGVEVTYSTKCFRLITDSDPEALNPDIAVSCSLADFVNGCDPALDVALGRQPEVD